MFWQILFLVTVVGAFPTLPPPPTTESSNFVLRPKGLDDCYVDFNYTVIETVDGVNITRQKSTRKCCEGFEGKLCLRIGNICADKICKVKPEAQCIVHEKCGRRMAVYVDREWESIIDDCHEKDELDFLSCSGSGECSPDPCSNSAECPPYSSSEVLCFPDMCNCRAVWIHIKHRTEIECQQQDSRRRRQTDCA